MTFPHLGSILRHRAATTPDRVAFVFLADGERDERPLTYAELDRRARGVAARLQATTRPGDRALLLFPPGLGFVVAFMGCVYANVVAVPAPAPFQDPVRLGRTLPRLRAIAADADAAVVLTEPSALEHRDAIAAVVGALPWLDAPGDPAAWAEPSIAPDDLIFLQYSSGSTGTPKGVMVSHANVMHNSAAIAHAFGHDATTVGVSWLPAYHDMGLVADVLQPVYAGFRMVFMSPFDFVARPMRWPEAIARHGATTSGAPNFAYALVADRAEAAEVAALDLSRWAVAYDCAEPVDAACIDRFAEAFAPAGFRCEAFFPYLGMAEATLMVTAGTRLAGPAVLAVDTEALREGRVDPAAAGRRLVANGPALPDQRVRIVDPATGLACAADRVGEVWVAGPSVARGYWGRPDATAEAFGAKLAGEPGAFMRTGDLGFLHGGALFLTGRLKDLIIVQGQNHYPQDLERSAEAAHPLVRPGCSAAFAVEADGREAVAIVAEVAEVAKADPAALADVDAAIRAAIFADHGLVAADVALLPPRALPKTSSGKVQRRGCRDAYLAGSLPALAVARAVPPAPAGAPSPSAEALAALVAELLGLARVGVGDRLFDLGGHSLLAARLAARVRERFGVDLPMRDLFLAPTIGDLAVRLEARPTEPLPPPIPPLEGDGPRPLSRAQARMWLAAQLRPDDPLYLMPALVRLRGPLDRAALAAAWRALVARHPALRTAYGVGADGAPTQAVLDVPFAVDLIDVAGEPDPPAVARRVAAEVATRPFDLARPPLIRVAVIRTAPDDHLMAVAMHHVASDGWSVGVLTRELATLYAGLREGEEPVLPPLPTTYAAYAAWERAWLGGDRLAALAARGRARLAGAPAALALPTDRPRPPVQAHRGATLAFDLPAELTTAVHDLARRADATPFMVLLAAFQVLLHRWSRQADVCVGVPVANRPDAALEGLVGFFANTVVVRADLGGAPAFEAFLRQVRERCLDAYADQDLPFDALVEAVAPPRDPSRPPLFQAMFVLQEAGMAAWRLAGIEATPEAAAAPAAKFDLMLELIPRGGGLAGRLEYDADLFDPARMATLARHYLAWLAAFVADPGLSIAACDPADLPAPAAAEAPTAAAPAPRAAVTPTETKLGALFAEVLADLEVPAIDVHASFFDLGGHSLLATRLAARIREGFGVALPLRALFEAPTVAALAAAIDGGAEPRADDALAAMPRGGPLPASPAQARQWFMEQLMPGSALYTHPAAFRLRGPLDVDALRRALDVLVARHEPLRTRFATDAAGKPVQLIDPPGPVPFGLVDVADAPEALARAHAAAHAAFDLARTPMLRAELARLAADDHVLILAFHHVAVDGWSVGLLLRELGATYDALRAGAAVDAMPPALQYADHVVAQRRWLGSEGYRAELAHWTARLAGAPVLLALPTDRPRPLAETYRGAKATFRLDQALVERVRALARAEGVTPFQLLLAAFQVLLHRHSGQADLCVGVPFANRGARALEPMVGLFVNTLVLRADLAGAPAFRAFLAQVRERCLDADAHQGVPFERLVEALNPPRDPGHHPLYQVMFTLQEPQPWALGGVGIQALEVPGELAKLDLSLDLVPDGNGMLGRVEYNRDLFDASTIDRLAGHYATLLGAIVEEPGTPVTRLPLLTPAERETMLVDWNRTGAAYPREGCVHQLFEAQARRTPEAIAVHFEGRELTYAALNAAANRLAHHLRGMGVGPDVLVGLCVERSADLVVAVLAILKAGGAYVPLDPGYPPDRVRFMREDAGARIVLAQASSAGLVAAPGVAVLRVDDPAPPWAGAPDHDPDAGVRLDHLISVIYTSGSTGKPKGVLNQHLGAYNHLTYRQGAYGMTPADRVIQKTSINFDGSVWELFWPLMVGARMVVLPPGAQMDGPSLCAFIQRHGITLIDFVPSMLQEVLAEGLLAGCTSLRRFFVGGELMARALADALMARMPQAALTHGYGPTETTVSVIYYDCFPGDPRPVVPLGRPIANTRLYVLDPDLQPVPVGVPGELHIGGDGLARGYHDRPELTAERFIADPFVPGERVYKSGDLARWLPDGNVEFLGRVDDQVKIRGFRIELGEIAAALDRHPAVREAVVIAREDEPGAKRLVAYVIAAGERPTPADLRAHLRAGLPEHMVPAAFVFLDRFPLAPNEKVDRRALPAPEADRSQAGAAYVAPAGEVETTLAALFAEVLGVPRVGAHDDFFDLGGHSLLATRLASRIRERLRAELPLRRIFEAPTVAGLAAGLAIVEAPALPPIVAAPRTGPEPLSYAQERLWFLDRLAPGLALYNIPAAYWLAGPLEVDALAQAFGTLVARHEALRTRIVAIDGVPAQVVDPPPSAFALPAEDLADRPDADAEALRRAHAEAAAPFDLGAGPLLRARLLRTGADRHLLVLNVHHAVSDGWSWGVMMRELAAAYAAHRAGAPPELPALPVQYADFARWQRAWLADGAVEAQLAPWRSALAGAPALLDLPTDRPRPATETYAGARVERPFGRGLDVPVRALAQRAGATPFMLLLAAFQALLHRWSGQPEVCVGVPIANRRHAALEPLIGFFVNTLVIRADATGDPGFLAFLARVQARCLDAYAHQDLPFEKLVEALNPARDPSHHPLFQALFVLQEAGLDAFDLADVAVAPEPLGGRTARFDLALELLPAADGWTARIEYASDLFEASTIDRFLAQLDGLLRAAVAAPETPLGALGLGEDVLPDAGPEVPFADLPFDRLFAAQVARAPGATAIASDDGSLTYAGLDARAEDLAARLRAEGVQAGDFVGLAVERGEGVAVGFLGILKAGAVYVPLDPGYPRERLEFMIADAGVALVVADAASRDAFPATPVVPLPSGERSGPKAPGEGLPCTPGVPRCPLPGPEGPTFSSHPTNPPGRGEVPAYLIYTSGSTGRPKGVLLPHRGLANLLAAAREAYGLGPATRLVQFASPSFDASIFELAATLGLGGTLVVGSRDATMPGPALDAFVRRHGVDVLHLPPSALAAMPAPGPGSPVKTVVVAGEACPVALAEAWGEHARVFNAYGPTEATVWSTFAALVPGEGRLPIGRPIANARAEVRDAAGRPVPAGVAGELWVAGPGLALGYLGRPDLTEDRFVADPDGTRWYRTGDRARRLADGRLAFLGRLDDQLKVRGFRVEPGEVAHALQAHPGVREAVVVARPEHAGQALTAYVAAAPADRADLERAHVDRWATLYAAEDGGAPAAAVPDERLGDDFTGWNSSFTGEPLPEAEMRAWRDATVARIRALKPSRVYEIGCGAGLLLAPLAPACEAYWASDFAPAALAQVDRLARTRPAVKVLRRPADDFSAIPVGHFDTIVLNSVAQYFPSTTYLARVLAGAWEALAPGGRVVVGDVRHHGLLAPFLTAVARHRAPDADPAAIAAEVARRARDEEELTLLPAWFATLGLPGLAVEPSLKRGAARNELQDFRFDVVLHKAAGPAAPVTWMPWQEGDDAEDVLMLLAAAGGRQVVGVRGIPNARVAEGAADLNPLGLDPDAFWANEAMAPGVLRVVPDADPGRFAVVLAPTGVLPDLAELLPAGDAPLAGDPLRGAAVARLAAALREHATRALPEHLRPSHYVVLDDLPRTPNGKVDRAALPAPEAARPAAGTPYAASRTPAEATLCALFAEVLGVPRVGIDDGFFELGGHSLLAVQLATRVRAELGVDLPLRRLFAAPTPAALAAELVVAPAAPPPAAAVIPRAEAAPGGPLSYSQAMWFTLFPSRAELEHGIQNSWAAIALDGPLDAEALARAFRMVIDRHEPLRTTFTGFGRRPARVVHDHVAFELPVHDAPDEAAADAALVAAAQAPFDLARGPLIRAAVYRLGPTRHRLLIAVSHLVFDGRSMKVLLDELGRAYAAYAAGREPDLAPLAIGYSDYVRWHRAHVRRRVLLRSLPYWLSRARRMPLVLDLPTDRPRPAALTLNGRSVVFALRPALVRPVRELAAREGVTPYMLLLAAFQVLLHRWAGLTDVPVGTPVANRPAPETQGLIGLFLNFVVLRGDLAGKPTFRAYLQRVKATCLGAYEHQDLPFQVLARCFRIYVALTTLRSFRTEVSARSNVMFNLIEDFDAEVAIGPLRGRFLPIEAAHASQTLHLVMTRAGEGLTGHLVYDADLFDHATIAGLAARYEALLASVLADPAQSVSAAAGTTTVNP